MITSINATGYGVGTDSTQRDPHCSQLATTAGKAAYLIACVVAPLLSAPISEQFGRRDVIHLVNRVYSVLYSPRHRVSRDSGGGCISWQ